MNTGRLTLPESHFPVLQKGIYTLLVRIREDAGEGPGTILAIQQASLIATAIVILIPFCHTMSYNSLEGLLPSVNVRKDWAQNFRPNLDS